MVEARPPYVYNLPGNVISATVGHVYTNMEPEYELPSSTHFGQFQKFRKIGVGDTVLPTKKMCQKRIYRPIFPLLTR